MSRLKDHFIEEAERLASHYEDEGMDPLDAYERAGGEVYDNLSQSFPNTLTPSDGAGHGTASAPDGNLQAREASNLPIRQAAEEAREQGA
jgi:hypothetical protein